MYDIDRKTAGRLMKVSIRTIDRYISTLKLSHERRDGRIWLDKKEIMKLKAQRRVDTGVNMSTSGMSIDKMDLIPVDMSIDSDGNTFHNIENEDYPEQNQGQVDARSTRRSQKNSQNHEVEFYKNMYEQLQQELKEKEQRLEMANYRVGQLESHIKETVPLLEYNRDMGKERLEKEQLRKELDEQVMELNISQNNYREERFNKRIYLILLFILLLLQPLWFLFPPK